MHMGQSIFNYHIRRSDHEYGRARSNPIIEDFSRSAQRYREARFMRELWEEFRSRFHNN